MAAKHSANHGLRAAVERAVQSVCRAAGFETKRATRRYGRFGFGHVENLEPRQVMSGMSVGMNLDWIADYEPAWMFKDAFQKSRSWMPLDYNTVTRAQTVGTHSPVVDSNGWPTQLDSWTNAQGQLIQQRLQTGMFGGTNASHPAGVYRAEWAGTATINFFGDATVAARGDVPDGRHFADLNVTPTNAGIMLRIDAMDATNPLRDMHVWMPDYNGESFVGDVWRPGSSESPFHPLFLERLQPFDTLRPMQSANTITSDEVEWSDRRPLTAARQAVIASEFQNGMSLEYQIELANELHSNPWFNMPHMANDDYVRNYATMVRDTLDPTLTIYVEWSNEVWNWAPGFEPHYWARAQADAEGVRIEAIVARETRRDFDIWSEVFAGQEERIVRTVGGFHAAPGQYGWNAQVLSRMDGHFDALSVAPYIAPPRTVRETYTTATTVDQVIADTQANIAPVTGLVQQCADMVRQYEALLGRDLQLVTYEGGTHLDIPGGAVYRQAFFEAAADPRMYGVMTDYLHSMEDAGVVLFNFFKFTDRRVPSLMGNDFGTLNRMDQPLATAHRYRALVDFIGESDPASSVVTIAATDAAGAEAGRDPATFTMTRTGGSNAAELIVNYSIGGTATNGSDFDSLSGSVTILAGQDSATVSLAPIDDLFIEGSETCILTLLDGDSYDLGTESSATANIASDDLPPTVTLAATDASAAEAGLDPALFTMTRTGPTTEPLTVTYSIGGSATAGSDFNALAGSVTIAAGQSSTTVSVTPINDPLFEAPETVVLTLLDTDRYDLGSASTATATITSDDAASTPPMVSIVASDSFAAEANLNVATFTIRRTSQGLDRSLTVNYRVSGTATNGSDFNRLSGTATLAAGATTTTIVVTPIDDTEVESTETIVLTLQSSADYRLGTAASQTATAQLTSNDQPAPVRPTVTLAMTDASVAEAGRDPGTFTVTRTGPTTAALVVNYALSGTATNGTDFDRLNGTVRIPAGQTSASVTVRPVDDSVVDANESVTVTLSAQPTYQLGSTTTGTVTIADNDAPTQQPLPVLMVIANRDFYYQEYADPRAQFEAAGIPVVVAAGRRELSTPHANSGQGSSSGTVMPDLALADVNAANYSAIVFVGGWGASAYQYAFNGTYNNSAYNGTVAIRDRVNQLINDFVAQEKLVTALCHGVSVLAWARVNGQSLLQGRTVSTYGGQSPASNIAAAQLSRWHSDVNGATVFTNGSIGNTSTRTDDVWVDGRIITGENFDSARQFGITIANRLRNP